MNKPGTRPSVAARQLALSAVDGKLVLDQGGIKVINQGERDGAMLYDLSVFPPRELAYLAMPTSLAGPPQSVAINSDQTLAVVTAAQKTDPADPTRTIPDTRITVIDLASEPARITQTLQAGLGPTGVSFSPDGRLVVVANRNDGTLSVFHVKNQALLNTATVPVGDSQCQPASTAFTPDGTSLLVTRDGDHFVSVFEVADGQVRASGRDISAGLKPYGLVVAPNGQFAVTANVGRVSGDADSISVIDLTRQPYRVVDTLGVAATPEAVVISPDGAWVVAVCHNGSTRAPDSPFFNPNGSLVVFRVSGRQLVRHAEHPIGRWAQGAAFSHDSAVLLVQNTVERELQVFRVDGQGFSDSGVRLPIAFGSFAAIRTADFLSA
jgi:DNA-binding beta-propeller fold protein YncE